MLENYLLIHKSILPEYYEKVLEARRLIEDGKANEVSQAVKMVGQKYLLQIQGFHPGALGDDGRA